MIHQPCLIKPLSTDAGETPAYPITALTFDREGWKGDFNYLSFGIKTFDGVVKSPPDTDAGGVMRISNRGRDF